MRLNFAAVFLHNYYNDLETYSAIQNINTILAYAVMRGRNMLAARNNGQYIDTRYGVPPEYYDPWDFDMGYDRGYHRRPIFTLGDGTYIRDIL